MRELAGDHVRHNTYFTGFPAGVPDTASFWAACLTEAITGPAAAAKVETVPVTGPDGQEGWAIDLLSLPSYGRYQHSFEQMLAAHEELIEALANRVTILDLAGPLEAEAQALYLRLAGSPVPLSVDDTGALRVLAGACAGGVQPDQVPVRESRAVINAARVRAAAVPLVTTVTDVLRLACELSGADVSLQAPPRFGSLRRAWRAALMAALDQAAAPGTLAEVNPHAEIWKRLGERLHPHEWPQYPRAQAVFAAARGGHRPRSLNARVEQSLAAGDITAAAGRLAAAPGMLWRSADRVIRAAGPGDQAAVIAALQAAAPHTAGRVLLAAREHFQNRLAGGTARVFAGRNGRAWAAADTRPPLDPALVAGLLAVVDDEITRRLPATRVVTDTAIAGAALPLSARPLPAGLGIFPRGSVTPVGGELLRFFTYWRQASRRTDYDLSALFLDAEWGNPRNISWTTLTGAAGEHSGDITDAPAPAGASEFINIRLTGLGPGFIIPQVHIYSGEGFDQVEEVFFGYMTRDHDQAGQPFEPRTVRMKSALYGGSRVAVPLVFMRRDDGAWYAKWLHLYQRGHPTWTPSANQAEGNRVTTAMLARSVVERDYLRAGYLLDRWKHKGCPVLDALPGDGEPVTWIGLGQPGQKLPAGSKTYPLDRIGDLIPA